MKAYDLYTQAPREHLPRCKSALIAIAESRLQDAAAEFRAVAVTGCTRWHLMAAELAADYGSRGGPELDEDAFAEAVNIALLPELSYAAFHWRDPGTRIVLLKRGIQGLYPTKCDLAALKKEEVDRVVSKMNERLGVLPAQVEAMSHGSAFGYHVPAANAVTCESFLKKLSQ